MIQSVFESKARMWQYILFLTGFAILQALSMLPLLKVATLDVFILTALQTLVCGVVGIMLIFTLKFGKFDNLPDFQRIINYVALVLLSLIASASGGFGLIWVVLGKEIADTFYPFLFLNGFLSLLLDLLLIAVYYMKKQVKEPEILPVEIVNEDNPFIAEKNDVELLERIAVKSGQKIHVIIVPEILYLQADGDYVHIFTMQGKYLKEQTMKYFEEHLPAIGFVRVHRSCIVNVEAISRIDLYEKQTQQLTLKNGHQIKVSQAGYKALRAKLSL